MSSRAFGGSLIPKQLPAWVRRGIRSLRPFHELQLKIWERQNPFLGNELAHTYECGSTYRLGIVLDWAQGHVDYLRACQELKVSYRVINLMADDWLDQVTQSSVEALLVRPMSYTSLWKQAFDERLQLVAERFNIPIVPSVKECWLYESKRRIRDWLSLYGFAQPETHVFFREDEALNFMESSPLPLVFKTDVGASASGIYILRSRNQGRRMIQRVFRRGLHTSPSIPQDRQWGCVLLQEYLPQVKEWRMVRIDRSVFCREKLPGADGLHSGSGTVRWAKPSAALLDGLWTITEAGHFTSMNVDFFEEQGGRLLVNELHAYFGGILPKNVDLGAEHKGRWLRTEEGSWNFDPGYFYQNACANLRVEMVLGELNHRRRGLVALGFPDTILDIRRPA